MSTMEPGGEPMHGTSGNAAVPDPFATPTAPPGMVAAPENAAPMGVPPAPPTGPYAWQSAPATAPRRRRRWPWFLAGGLVVLAALVSVAVTLVIKAINADQNAHYDAAPIAAGDAPELGDFVVVSDNGKVAFEGLDSWYDASTIPGLQESIGSLPKGATAVGIYFAYDPTAPSMVPQELVMVMEGSEPGHIGSQDIAELHDEVVAGAMKAASGTTEPTWTYGPFEDTTAHGLDGFKSEANLQLSGLDVVIDWYTYERKGRFVIIQVARYDGKPDTEFGQLITDTLRIDP